MAVPLKTFLFHPTSDPKVAIFERRNAEIAIFVDHLTIHMVKRVAESYRIGSLNDAGLTDQNKIATRF